MNRKTFGKILAFLAILVLVVLGFWFAPRVALVTQGMFSASEANDEDSEAGTDADEEQAEPEEYDDEEAPYQPPEEEEYIPEEVERPSLVPEARAHYGNDDIVARITIPGTAIDYLITHTDNNVFYLYHSIRGYRTAAGTVFLDYLNTPDFSDPNSIIYGHNMRNGTKFHDLRMYRSQEFFEENNLMIVTSAYDVLYYDIFAVFTTHINFNYIQVHFEDGEFLELVEEMKSRSYHQTDIEIEGEDKILVLSTCWGPIGTNYRLVVVGKLRTEVATRLSL